MRNSISKIGIGKDNKKRGDFCALLQRNPVFVILTNSDRDPSSFTARYPPNRVRRSYMIFILIAIGIFVLELKIKNYIENNRKMREKEEILGGNIILNRYHNKGAFLNIFENNVKLVKILSCVLLGMLLITFIIILPKEKKTGLKLALSLMVGGGSSNIYDRFKRGYVVDYFSFKFLRKVIFNISDICIIIGAVILMILGVFHKN